MGYKFQEISFWEYFIMLEVIRDIAYFIRINKKYLGMPCFYIIEK